MMVSRNYNYSEQEVKNLNFLETKYSQAHDAISTINKYSLARHIVTDIAEEAKQIKQLVPSIKRKADEVIQKNIREIKKFPLLSLERVQALLGFGKQASTIHKIQKMTQSLDIELQSLFLKEVELIEKRYLEAPTDSLSAIKALQLLVGIGADNTDTKALVFLSKLFFQEGMHKEAVSYYKKISYREMQQDVQLHIDYISSLIELGSLSIAQQRIDELQSLPTVQADKEFLQKLCLMRADLYFREEKYSEAGAVLKSELLTTSLKNPKMLQDLQKMRTLIAIATERDIYKPYYLSDAKNRFLQLPHIVHQMHQENSLVFELEFWLFVLSISGDQGVINTAISSIDTIFSSERITVLSVMRLLSRKIDECEKNLKKTLVQFDAFTTSFREEEGMAEKINTARAQRLNEQLFTGRGSPSILAQMQPLIKTIKLFSNTLFYKKSERAVTIPFKSIITRLHSLVSVLSNKIHQIDTTLSKFKKYFLDEPNKYEQLILENGADLETFLLPPI